MKAVLGWVCLAASACGGGGGARAPGNDAATTADAPAGAAPDAAPDARPPDPCPGIAIRGDGVLDLDVKSLAISGRVTLAGAALPDEQRRLQFVDTRTADSAVVAIAADGTYATTLGPSVYDVRWLGGGTCDQRTSPCIDGTLRSQLAITTSGVLDLDVPRVRLTGRVRLDGAAFPGAARGTLRFSSASGAGAVNTQADIAIDAAAASYAVVLLPGRYDVAFDVAFGDDADCAGPAPCNAGMVRTQVDVTTSGVLDLDLASVHVSGKLTVNGQRWIAGTGAAVELRRTGEPRAGVLPVGADGSFDGIVAPGHYEVRYRGAAFPCGTHAAAAPCNSGVLRRDLALTASGVLDLDVPMVTITGALSLAGAGFPATPRRGSLTFAQADDETGLAIAASGDHPRYEIALVAGRYQVRFIGDSAHCTPPVPCNAGTLRADVAMTSDGVLDLDIPTVRVSGVVTANGAALPVLGGELRGAVRFVGGDAGATSASVALGAAGAASYVVALLPGRYDVRFEGSPALCLAAPTAVPCNRGTLKTALSVTADGALDLDLPTAHVTGKVRLNGGAMPVQPGSIAAVAWQLAGEVPIRLRPFADAGTAAYDVTLLEGQYVVRYAADRSTCGATSATPCLDQPLAGCR